ncbi:LysR family transcriptional regulator [Bordetella hinzii]|uniref:LysR family transcriptional regulator n=1 Tax=Bordetella hinzii TaxID=103855 RepID=A0AAN1RTF5_9BORD|nr:LysR family transcriptional regulator [Bordetella hinzii]AKQ54522.1 HTH-type transcriptional regulator GltC [Bordetella hinzii]AKQ59035.1 HTH-type transcriptional regulator GltC [Bordetella hinzii]AZW15694.1 LysR family transcriptional regulator [Bordetella hinzii]KCB31455.1 LysR substrate-binding domain protein [Bordetella hinzii L60]KCB47921.1 LysR substrate-binding domain protein [Bordetella hinzii 4161]
MTLSIPELEAVLLVAETRNFRMAAERAHVSQPALSRRVQAAEHKLNAKLFDRDKHRVALTDAGAELVPIAQRMLSEFRDSLSDLSEFIAGRRGSVNIWALPSVAAAILPTAAQAFQQSHPQVRLLIHAASARQVTQAVSDGEADIGISIEVSGQPPDVEFTSLLQENFVLICPVGDPLARRKRVDWTVFAERPFVASGSASSIRQVTDRILAAAGRVPEANYVSDNISVVGAMVAAGVGIAAVPQLALGLMDTTRLRSVPLDSPTATREIGILVKKRRSLSAAVQRFIDTLRLGRRESRPAA